VTEPSFPIIDKRGRTRSGLQVGGLSTEMNRLRQAGVSLSKSGPQARVQAKKYATAVGTPGQLSEDSRKLASEMRRSRLASMKLTGSDVQVAMPKMRIPGGSLIDQGVPIDIHDPEELRKARMWARLYYATHDLVPLLIDIYSRFPMTGLEFRADDSRIENFFSEMFLDDLDYEDFLPNCIGREFFVAGEVTTLGHFDERLGTWASEEVLDPDRIRVSKSVFIEQERVQLLVKDMVDALRNPPHQTGTSESQSERMERNWELEQLQKYHPEIIAAATQDDGLDIAEGLWSRLVNKANANDLRGTPPLMRSFRTLLSEESLNSAQDAVADRLYSPLVLATLGIENFDDAGPWLPKPEDLDDLRNDMQTAMMADFKLMVHHMGLKIENVFGRESVPRFDQDYDRIQMKLMQAWGIGQALIMGGTAAAGTYASSALNREVVELNMKDFQRKAAKHIKKRMEVVAEAQRFFAYEKKGSQRIPLWRSVVRVNPETGEEEVVKTPKLLMPEVHFASLNLRDEATERQFYMDLRGQGVPVSDKTLSINLETDFDQEIKRQSEEQVDKLVAQAESFAKAKQIIDTKNRALPVEQQMPYPPDLINYLNQTLVLRQQMAAAEMAEGQNKMMDQQAQMMTPAGQLGILPPPASAAPPGEQQADEPLNRARPAESDEMRANAPRAAKRRNAKRNGEPAVRKTTWLERGPSSYGDRHRVSEEDVTSAVRRREAHRSAPRMSDLVESSDFFLMVNSPHEDQIRADYPEIRAGGAPESAAILKDLADQYEYNTGIRPSWDD
jgi:hypothetical protein